MKRSICFLFFLYCCLIGRSQTPVTDALVHEIITECISKTGGFIKQEKTVDNQDKLTLISLPENLGHSEISKVLMPIMIKIENYFYPISPWRLMDNNCLCNFNLAKDGSNRLLAFIFVPDNHCLIINDSPTNSSDLSMPDSFIEKLQNFIIWGSINQLGGFIRALDIPSENVFKVAIQLQKDTSTDELINDLKSITTTLEAAYYLAKPWKQNEKGFLECEFFAQLKKERKNMIIHFCYFPNHQVLAIDFITDDAE